MTGFQRKPAHPFWHIVFYLPPTILLFWAAVRGLRAQPTDWLTVIGGFGLGLVCSLGVLFGIDRWLHLRGLRS